MKLKRRNWSRRNHEELSRLLDGVRPGEIAVFDWDNTCAFNDVGEALLRRLAFDLAFRVDAVAMAATVPDRINGIGRVNVGGRPYPLQRMKAAVFSALQRLQRRPLPARGRGVDKDYRVFTSGLLAMNRALEETPGIGCAFAYPWVNTLLRGLALTEFDRLAAAAINGELRAPVRRRALVDPQRRWRYDWTSGIRLYPEMRELAACWQQRGGEVVVSSASNRQLVEKAIDLTGFPCRRVIGMELKIAGDRFGGALAPGLRPNLGRGKVANIRRRLGGEPVLVAGDSSNDFEMLTAFPATRLRLVIDRRAGGAIRRLVELAHGGADGFLVQEIDPRAGKFTSAGCRGRALAALAFLAAVGL
ncbi:MAG: haloacid dehalogenase-like hydrolase [Acidobacteria bacterium]|jgi:phosphoserine phosphatase|nr:haloacid dehalogenase-like hydrolase [Acidobacteriota bacterium]